MVNYNEINDEEELHKMMNNTEDFDERKKIRARIKELRDKQREEWEKARKEREAKAEDAVKKKFEKAEEEKRKKMEAYKNVAPTHEREGKYHEVSQSLIADKQKLADEEKAKKMAAYSSMGTSKTTAAGTSYAVKKTPAKPQNAMAAFKSMDNAANPNPAKPKVARSPSAIKQVLLDWTKAMTREYSNVEITNFSTSWNNGMAFCALIHHFYPKSFDFSTLEPKNRRFNFNLAFDTAEKEADIAPLLDVEDMVRMKTPDWKCVFTYVQSIYRHLKDHENNKAATAEQ